MPIIQSIERALRILDLFDENETELKITEISERMGLSKSTVHSLLKTLQLYRYIEQNPENGKYRLGMKLFERGNFVISRLDIRTVAKRFFWFIYPNGQAKRRIWLSWMAKKGYTLTR